jgi:hypothetical protein
MEARKEEKEAQEEEMEGQGEVVAVVVLVDMAQSKQRMQPLDCLDTSSRHLHLPPSHSHTTGAETCRH